MAVYVDNYRARRGRLVFCHMIADSEEELHAMAQRIGVQRKWYQGDHYDVCLAKRAEAVRHGARQVTMRELVKVRERIRAQAIAALRERIKNAIG